jgi:hypothetical protein
MMAELISKILSLEVLEKKIRNGGDIADGAGVN